MASIPLLTLDELCAQVALALAVDYDGSPNNRIRDVPDRRAIRYYTTLGLIDRPARMRGRTALYGRRHLLQLVAIKRLQANGLELREVQQRLLGLSNSKLETLARVPELPEAAASPEPEPSPVRPDFWKTVPEPQTPEPSERTNETHEVYQALKLTDRVLLMLPLARVPDAADLESLRAAAAPLLQVLNARNLI
jgi:DNA-binding transcriptional MerR regulator